MSRPVIVRRVATGLALSLIGAGIALAETPPRYDGYITDQNGRLVRDSYGHCWKTQFWTPAMAIAECDPDLVPKPVAAQGPPAREQPPVAAPTGPERPAFEAVTLQEETLFDFDRTALRAGEQKDLDDIAAKMKSAPQVEKVQVTGHADRLGTEQYNMRLSQKRAEAVKDYLVGKGVAADRIEVVAKGESEPTPDTAKCKGDHKTPALVSCLQPDRNVVVEVKVQRPTSSVGGRPGSEGEAAPPSGSGGNMAPPMDNTSPSR